MKILLALPFVVMAFLVGMVLRAQSPQAYTMQGTAAHTTCITPVAGSYFLCVATDGVWVSNSGGAYFQILPQAAQVAGVTSLSVNGGAAQTGSVALTIPTKATSSTTTTIQ